MTGRDVFVGRERELAELTAEASAYAVRVGLTSQENRPWSHNWPRTKRPPAQHEQLEVCRRGELVEDAADWPSLWPVVSVRVVSPSGLPERT